MRKHKVLLWIAGVVLLLVFVGIGRRISDDSTGNPTEVQAGSMDAVQKASESNADISTQSKPSPKITADLTTNQAVSVEAEPLLIMLQRAMVVKQAEEQNGNELVRKTLYLTDFKYPLVLEKEFVEQTGSGQEKVVRREIMVGNHVMARFPAELSSADVEQWASRHGY
ncbi:MAG TPA: hypothetical protein VIR63_00300, partial [Pontiella sp.]